MYIIADIMSSCAEGPDTSESWTSDGVTNISKRYKPRNKANILTKLTNST